MKFFSKLKDELKKLGGDVESEANAIDKAAHRDLTEIQQAIVKTIKEDGAKFTETLRKLGNSAPIEDMSWELRNAHRAAQEAIMWAVKHVTR